MDLDKLKKTLEHSNQMFRLWDEYNQLRRNVPSPHGWGIGAPQCFSQAWVYEAGTPQGVDWFKKLVEIAEINVKAGVGPVPEEKIRLFWFDLLPFGWVFEFLPWLESEWGAVMVMDMFANFPYTMIDTSSEEQMWLGLAKRNLFDSPMVRQLRRRYQTNRKGLQNRRGNLARTYGPQRRFGDCGHNERDLPRPQRAVHSSGSRPVRQEILNTRPDKG